MIDQKVRDALTPFFPRSFNVKSTFLDTEEGKMVAEIIIVDPENWTTS